MTEKDRDAFLLLLDGLASGFGVEPTTGLKFGYWMGLSDLPLADVERAINRAVRECRFMPKPVELRQLSGETTTDQRAVLAWDALKRAISQHGYRRSVDFDDPVINATIRNLGGWHRLCTADTSEFEKWGRKDFERVYGSLCSSGTSPESCAHLPGADETENGAAGFAVEAPRRVITGLPPHRAPHLVALSERATADTLRLVSR